MFPYLLIMDLFTIIFLITLAPTTPLLSKIFHLHGHYFNICRTFKKVTTVNSEDLLYVK